MAPVSYFTVALLFFSGTLAFDPANKTASEACSELTSHTFLPSGTFFAESRCALRCAFDEGKGKGVQQYSYRLYEGKACPLNKWGTCKEGVCLVPEDWQVDGHLEVQVGTLELHRRPHGEWHDALPSEGFVQVCVTNISGAVHDNPIYNTDDCAALCFTPLVRGTLVLMSGAVAKDIFKFDHHCNLSQALTWDPNDAVVVFEFWSREAKTGNNHFIAASRFFPAVEDVKLGKTQGTTVLETKKSPNRHFDNGTITHSIVWTPIRPN